MNKWADITFRDHEFIISGDLNFSNVMSVYEKCLPQIQSCADILMDFSLLKSSDSSGIALVIEWVKFARQYNKSIRIKHLSKDLMSLAKAAGLDGIIVGTNSSPNN